MKNSALVVIDLQNDITKHYREIIENVNAAISWAIQKELWIIYIQHNNLSAGTRTFKPGTRGAELVPELNVVSDHIFKKSKSSGPDQRGLYGFHPGKRYHRILSCRSRRRGLHQIHLLQSGETRILRACAVGLHHELRQKEAAGAARLL